VVNLRISRAFAFGTVGGVKRAAAAKPQTDASKAPAGGSGGPSSPPGDIALSKRMTNGPAPQAPTEKRYTLNVSINFQNVLNHVNLAPPVGNLSSPSFGESLALAGSFGGFGGPAGGSAGAGNRRIYAQVRFNF